MQGSCGSCWAFAAVAVVEAALKIKKNIDVDLSEQELIDCSDFYGNKACSGGFPFYSLAFVVNNGLNTEEEYPYHDRGHTVAVSKERREKRLKKKII